MTDLLDFPRAHPDCEHCGTVLRAITPYPQSVHDTCPCICHNWRTTRAKHEAQQNKRKRKK